MTDTPYLLGDDDPELRRLADQHLTWSEATLAGWRAAELKAGEHVLDVGCGPGFTTLELARLVGPQGCVVGIDPSDRFARHLREQAEAQGLDHLTVRKLRAEDLPADQAFDLIHVRWVLCFLSDPAAAIASLARLLAPGGRLLTLDYFNYRAFALAPRIDVMEEVVAAIGESWGRSGGSLEVQGETPTACARAGLEVTGIEQVSGIARPGEARFRWPEQFLAGYLPRLVEDGLLDADTVERFWDDWRQRVAEPGTFLYLPPLLQVIARQPG